MLIFDAHLDLAMNAIDWNRNLRLEVAELRRREADLDKKGVAKVVGKAVAERAVAKGIKEVIFDRGGYIYTGRVAELAAGAREGGLDF